MIRAVVSGGAGGSTPDLEVLLTLFQPEGADYVHHITASTPGFENLTTSLYVVFLVIWARCISMQLRERLNSINGSDKS